MLRRVARGAIAAGAGSFVLALLAVVLLLVASAGAPPPVERRTLDYDDRPASVVADAVHDLGAEEYAYDVRVVESGGHVVGDGPEPIVAQHVAVDNPARRYRGTVFDPGEEGRTRQIRFYSESFVGYRHVPASLGGGGWSRNRDLAYAGIRNAFFDVPPRDASATVVAENGTTYVARLTDPAVAVDVAHPGYPHPFTSFGTVRPPLDNVTANLTVTIDKRTGRVTGAVMRYHNPDPGGPYERDLSGPRTSVVTYEFSDYGSTAVDRPLLTLPPQPRTLLYRLDLGVWALAEGRGWAPVAVLVGRLLVVGLLLALAAVGVRRGRWEREAPYDRLYEATTSGDLPGPDWRRGIVDRFEVPDIVADVRPTDRDADWEAYARAANLAYAAVLSTLWLLAVAVVVASAAVGPAPGPDVADAPTVDPDGPPDEVAADAVARLEYRSHTVEYWWRDRNRTDGSADGGIAVHLRVQHAAERVRVQVYRSVVEDGWTEPSDPPLDFYGTSATRHQRVGPGGAWRRTTRGGYTYRGYRRFHFWDADTFRGAGGTVRSENATALVLVFTDPDVVEDVGPSLENATRERVLVVVRKQPSPHLS